MGVYGCIWVYTGAYGGIRGHLNVAMCKTSQWPTARARRASEEGEGSEGSEESNSSSAHLSSCEQADGPYDLARVSKEVFQRIPTLLEANLTAVAWEAGTCATTDQWVCEHECTRMMGPFDIIHQEIPPCIHPVVCLTGKSRRRFNCDSWRHIYAHGEEYPNGSTQRIYPTDIASVTIITRTSLVDNSPRRHRPGGTRSDHLLVLGCTPNSRGWHSLQMYYNRRRPSR